MIVIAVVVVAAGLIIGAGGLLLARSGPSSPGSRPPSVSPVTPPDDWDERVTDLVDFVEEHRGHEFDRPVAIHFLDADGYRDAVLGDDLEGVDDLGVEEEDDEDDHWQETMRALGLLHGEIDEDEMTEAILDTGTLAVYVPASEEIFVRGTEPTPAVRETVVHELTHALQDQLFDLGRLADDDRADVTLRDVAEGDATRIAETYTASLGRAEREEILAESQATFDEAQPILDEHVPGTVQAILQAPYLYGLALVMLADAEGGNDAVDDLFRDPPSEFVVYDPVGAERGETAADQVILDVSLPDGAVEDDDGSFGAISWYLLLSTAIDPLDAMHATDGIHADGHRTHVRDGRLCVTAHARSSSPDDLLRSLRSWASAVESREADVDVVDDTVVLETCDPGPDGPEPPPYEPEVIMLPMLRTVAYAGVIADGGDAGDARCFSEGFLEILPLDQLLSGDYTGADEKIFELVRTCSG